MKRTRTTTVIALVVALLLVTTAGSYGAIAHNRAVARAQAATVANDAVATAQPAADSQTQTAPTTITPPPTVTAPTLSSLITAGTTTKSASGSKPSTATPPATRPPETSRGGNVRSPLAGRTIFVDAGHGISGSGANGPNGGDEAANNLATALILRNMLQSAGARVVMTRTTMINPTVPGRTSDQLEARTIMANESGADMFISLHENMSDGYPGARGLTVYYRSDSASIKLAQKIDVTTVASTGWYNWGTDVGPYYVLNNSTLKAAVLVECGFLSNATDEHLLGTNAFRQKVAQGVFNGIVAYFQ